MTTQILFFRRRPLATDLVATSRPPTRLTPRCFRRTALQASTTPSPPRCSSTNRRLSRRWPFPRPPTGRHTPPPTVPTRSGHGRPAAWTLSAASLRCSHTPAASRTSWIGAVRGLELILASMAFCCVSGDFYAHLHVTNLFHTHPPPHPTKCKLPQMSPR